MKSPTPSLVRRLKYHLLVTFIATSLSLVSLISVSIAWFQSNRIINANLSGVYVRDLYDVTISLKQDGVSITDGIIHFEDFFPGVLNEHEVEIAITNNSDSLLYTTWYFRTPSSEQEVPYVDTAGTYGPEGYYYYFGSQIQVSDVYAEVGSTTVDTGVGEGEYLIETNSVGLTQGQVNGVSSPITSFSQFYLLDDFGVDVGQTATIIFTLTFVDNLTNQNVYQLAWPTSGVSERQLGLYLLREEP